MEVDNLVALAQETLRPYPEFDVDSAAAREALQKRIGAALDNCDACCLLDDGARGGIIVHQIPGRTFDRVQRCVFELAQDEEAYTWAVQQMVSLAPFDVTLELRLDVAHEALIEPLEEAGLRPRLRWLHGSPARALEGLRSCDIPQRFDDLEIVAHPSDRIDASLALLKEVFTSEAEFGFLPPRVEVTPERQAKLDAFVGGNIADAIATGTAWAVVRGHDVVGHAITNLRSDPLLGRVGGLGIAIDASIRRRGVGKRLYEVMLERMIALDVDTMAGRTGNPWVIRLAERMQRPLRAWQLEAC